MFVVFLAVLSGFLQLGGYFSYGREILSGRIKPNTASWSIWTFGALLESSSYIILTGDLLKNILPAVCAICAIILFLFCLVRGRFKPLDRFEKIIVVADILTIIVWWFSRSAFYANSLAILTAFISFIPILRHAWRDPRHEDATPWFIWTAAYTSQLLVVLARWEKWEDLFYPALFIILHLAVALLAMDVRKRKLIGLKTAGTVASPIA